MDENDETENYINFKICFVGSYSVGKTTLINKFINNKIDEDYNATIGLEFFSKNLVVDESNVRVQIWDTAGQEKYAILTKSYYVSSNSIILVFDLSKYDSFQNLNFFLKDIKNYSNKNCLVKIIGNKSDLEKEVSNEMIENLMIKTGYEYYETNFKEGKIDEIIEKIVKEYLKNYVKIESNKRIKNKKFDRTCNLNCC